MIYLYKASIHLLLIHWSPSLFLPLIEKKGSGLKSVMYNSAVSVMCNEGKELMDFSCVYSSFPLILISLPLAHTSFSPFLFFFVSFVNSFLISLFPWALFILFILLSPVLLHSFRLSLSLCLEPLEEIQWKRCQTKRNC